MHYQSSSRIVLFFLLLMAAANPSPVWAWGPLLVTGPGALQPGQPYRWNLSPIPYRTDRGSLGNQSNLQANSLVASALQVWQSVATASISFSNAGQLSTDITASNYLSFYNALLSCNDSSQPSVSIVYDVDGSIITALGGDSSSTLGFSEALCVDTQSGYITRGWSILNGRFIDGVTGHSNVTLAEFQTVFVHETGHLLGLDHSQVNVNCLVSTCTADELAGVPLMFPLLLDGASGVPNTDDIAGISLLYPTSSFASTTGRIQGSVYFSDGLTPAQGYNVIARKVGDPKKTAVSCISGFLYTAAPGNTLVPTGFGGSRNDNYSSLGSRDSALIGYYDIPGLPPGNYTVEVEAINDSGDIPFIDSSSVGPIGAFYSYQYKLPGTCTLQYLHNPSSPSDSCSVFSTLTVGSGSIVTTGTDVIFLGTFSRFDGWEDEGP